MRRIHHARFLLLALAAVGLSLAVASSSAEAKYGSKGACLHAGQPESVLELRGNVGTPFEATDFCGAVVASGFLTQPYAVVHLPGSPPGPDGVVVHLNLGGSQFHMTTDPDWLWD